MRAEVYICDVCGVQKQDSNHWFIKVPDGVGFCVEPWEMIGQYSGSNMSEPIGHLCGPGCVSKKLSEWLSKQE